MIHIKLFENFLNESPFGPQGYFPPMGATPNDPARKIAEEIYKPGVAISVAKALKKFLDRVNPELEKFHSVCAPFVNYYPNTREGNLILGVSFSDLPGYNYERDSDGARELRDKFGPEVKDILSNGKTQIWSGYHRGMNGYYKKVQFKSGIVYSIVTPGRQFSPEMERKLSIILDPTKK